MNNLNNQRWLGTKLVKVLRHFTVEGVSYTSVKPLGEDEDLVVLTAGLTEQPNKEFEKVVSDGQEVEARSEKEEQTKNGDGQVETAYSGQDLDEKASQEVETSADDEPVIESLIIAKSTTNEVELHIIGTVEELDLDIVKDLKLDPDAIQRVLDGKQRTHKGYTFEISEVKN